MNLKGVDAHITGNWGEDQLSAFEELEDDAAEFESEEARYAKARKVGILELMDSLSERDKRIDALENELRILRGFVAHALRLAGDREDADGLDEVNRNSLPGRVVER